MDKLPTRLSEGKSNAGGGYTIRRSASRQRDKENDIDRLRTSTEVRDRLGKDYENVSSPHTGFNCI
jgi:hypothetical protein